MKVAVVTDSPFLCEQTMYLSELKKTMESLGVTVDLFSLVSSSYSSLEGKIPIRRLLSTSMIIPTIRKYDIAHVQFTFPIGFLLTLLRGLHRKPVIIHTHGDDVFVVPSAGIGFRRSKMGELATDISWRAASQIIAVCERSEEEIMKVGVPRTKINVLYNGVNENFFLRKRNREESNFADVVDGADFTFLNVGGLKEVKNQLRLLLAFSLYSKESQGNSRLVICGSGHLDQALRESARKLGIAERVVFLGKVPHFKMPELYTVADAYVLPSLHEAHPWSILEAMSCELPVAASRVGGIPETINNEQLLVNPWKVDDICRAMLYLAEDSERSRKIGVKNRKTVLDRFTLKRHSNELKSIYSKVLQNA